MAKEGSAETTIRDIKRKTRRKYNTEEKIRSSIGRIHPYSQNIHTIQD